MNSLWDPIVSIVLVPADSAANIGSAEGGYQQIRLELCSFRVLRLALSIECRAEVIGDVCSLCKGSRSNGRY